MKPTYLARLTPPGTAALATLALCGPAAWTMVRELVQPALPVEPELGCFWLRRLGDELGRNEVVLSCESWTADRGLWTANHNDFVPQLPAHGPWSTVHVEIHCHGGQQVLQWLEDIFVSRGAVVCSWQEFQLHAGCPDWQVKALDLLTRAPTVRTAAILLDQYHGACQRVMAEIQAHRDQGREAGAQRLLDALNARIPLGRHLVEPWRIVIAGAVNAGKSSLVNALAGHTRTVVSPQPGTTRDVVTTRLALDGWPVEIADTAGWRQSDDPLERAALDRGRVALEEADLVLWLLDGSAAPVYPNAVTPRVVFVINKTDLPSAWNHDEIAGALSVSAKTGAGVPELGHHLANLLVPNPPAPGEAVPLA